MRVIFNFKIIYIFLLQVLYMNIQELAVMAKVRKVPELPRTLCPLPIEEVSHHLRSVRRQVQPRPQWRPQPLLLPAPMAPVPYTVESKCVTNRVDLGD